MEDRGSTRDRILSHSSYSRTQDERAPIRAGVDLAIDSGVQSNQNDINVDHLGILGYAKIT